ncbi:hypothetical protein V490_08058 [Pseudogymnoascus sp. VKM F-3557]|nr:hypothetical protein V490_08058 [Pseudogymnoascus sp. VKM F-3557]
MPIDKREAPSPCCLRADLSVALDAIHLRAFQIRKSHFSNCRLNPPQWSTSPLSYSPLPFWPPQSAPATLPAALLVTPLAPASTPALIDATWRPPTTKANSWQDSRALDMTASPMDQAAYLARRPLPLANVARTTGSAESVRLILRASDMAAALQRT